MSQNTITRFFGEPGRNERFQFGGGIRALIETLDGDDKVSTRTNGLVDMIVHGGAGRDILELGSGADIIYGDNPSDGADGDPNVIGNFNRDAILGGGNNDTIFSQAGDDVVDGENGDDYIYGGLGNDFLQGGLGNDHVLGGAGNDTIYGGNAPQTLIPGLTIELVWDGTTNTQLNGGLPVPIDSKATAVSPALTGTGNDLLYGGDGNDKIFGQDGADLIDGGAGLDTAFYSSSATAVAINLNVEKQVSSGEAAGDTLISIENIGGSLFGDRLTGNGVANVLSGNAGVDVLAGGGGKDALAGGPGTDFFVFDTPLNATTNVDTLSDFSHADDTIRLENAVFKTVGAVGVLAVARFFVGAKAHDADDRIIYNKTTGQLFYDDDGTGAHAQVLFAVLPTKPVNLASNDFAVI